MELKRQRELEMGAQAGGKLESPARPLVMVAGGQVALGTKQQQQPHQQQLIGCSDTTKVTKANRPQQQQQQPKRVRGRRSSKPQMEKRRRARINECLDILKSYVLTDSSNLNRLGIDLAASENQDEETIARSILKSSGLINRHRGRKNPNKLEKADILELTVDYVRRLHEQRNELLAGGPALGQQQISGQSPHCHVHPVHRQPKLLGQQVVPAHLNQPLTLDLSPKGRLFCHQHALVAASPPPDLQAYAPPPNTPLTPPSSTDSAPNQNGPKLAELQQHHMISLQALNQNQVSQMILSRVLDGRKFA